MKIFGTELKSTVNLLPLDSFQRHLLSGISGVLVWLVVSVWPFGDAFIGSFGWNWSEPAPLLNGLAYHLSESLSDMRYAVEVDAFSFIAGVSRAILGVVPSIVGIALLVASAVMVLGAFKIVTYPARIQLFAPAVLGLTIRLMLLISIFVPPANSITAVVFPKHQIFPQEFSFSIEVWIDNLLALCIELAIPTAILAISLIPIFAPEKKGK